MSSRFFAGLDLGQAADYTALVIAEQLLPPEPRPVLVAAKPGAPPYPRWEVNGAYLEERPAPVPARYDVRHIQRFALGTPYPAIVAQVGDLLSRPELGREVSLVIDGTGVGRPVVDLFAAQMGAFRLVPVLITGGDTQSRVDDWHHVPKKVLISTVQVLLQSGRLRIGQFPETTVLTSELQNYRVKVTQAANETFNAREGAHDDLVLALALALWNGEQPGVQIFIG